MQNEWHTIDTPTAHAETMIARQLEWEYECINRGVDRYRSQIASANAKAVETKNSGGLIETDAGAVMLREMVSPLVPAIKAAQEAALRGFSGKGHRAKWWIPVLSLEPDKWAVITARSALTGIAPDMQDARPTTSVALNISAAAKLQREFDLWKARESKETREAKERGEHRANLYQVMLRSVKKVDKRAARKWMLLSDNIDHLDWSKDERISVGMLMLSILAEHGGGWFELAYIRKSSGRGTVTERVIRLTEAGRRWINNHNAMTELQRPWLLPMLCPPKAWRWVDAQAEEPDSQASEDTPVPSPDRAGQEEVHA